MKRSKHYGHRATSVSAGADTASTSLMSHRPCCTLTPHVSALRAQTSQEQPTESVAAGLQSCYFHFFLCVSMPGQHRSPRRPMTS